MAKKKPSASKKNPWDSSNLVFIDIAKINIGHRFRKDPSRNIKNLMDSIESVGLLQYPLVDLEFNLICGERRITALKKMGHTMVPVIRADITDPMLAQMAENEYREGWTPEERMDCIRKMADEERGNRGRGGNWTKRVGKAVGLSGTTVHKAFQIMKSAEENPERYGSLAQKLRKTGKVDGIYQEFKGNQREIRGIKTVYKGITFRSQTEARWAALFDMRGSGIDSWKYEPAEMNGWFPDFELKLGTDKYFVEVKADTDFELLFNDLQKIERSGVYHPVWKLGGGVFAEWPDKSGRVMGIMNDFSNNPKSHCWMPLIRAEDWSELWKKACLITQWKSGKHEDKKPVEAK